MNPFTSRFLKYFARGSLAFPVLYIVLVAVLFDIPLARCLNILFLPAYYGVSLAVFVAGYGFLEMKRWAWYVFIFSQGLLTAENTLLILNYSESHNKVLAFAMSVIFQLCVVYLVTKEVRGPYFFPKIRWWESDPRYKLSAPAFLSRSPGEHLEATLLDVSTIGCFVKTGKDFTQGEILGLEFEIFKSKIACDATVVWCASSSVTHPKGIGLKFKTLKRGQKKSLNSIQNRIRKIRTLYRKYRMVLSQEEFLSRLSELEAGPLK